MELLDRLPKSVFKWFLSTEEPMMLIKCPDPIAMMVAAEDDPEIIEEVYRAYLQIMVRKSKKRENQKVDAGD
jgi:hypothetical protein